MRFVNEEKKTEGAANAQLQVIAAGLPRCATSSLQAVFVDDFHLGPCMHMDQVAPYTEMLKLTHAAVLEKDKTKRQAILRKIFNGYNSTSDFPGMVFVDDLMEMYPDAKIILNQRKSPEAWATSIDRSLKYFGSKTYLCICYLMPTDYWHYQIRQAVETLFRERYGDVGHLSANEYRKHNEWVKAIASKQKREVLEWEPGMGWDPLCKFLEKPVPKKPFPRLNDASFIWKLKVFLTARGLLSWGAVLSAPAVAMYAYLWMKR